MLHFRDDRRPVGQSLTGGRADGTGYVSQTLQYPIICAKDIVEERVTQGSKRPVTDDPRRVTCKDCRERLTLR